MFGFVQYDLSESSSSDNLVFMTNQGGSTGCSGEWTICGGSSQSYADASVSLDARCFFFQRPCVFTPPSHLLGITKLMPKARTERIQSKISGTFSFSLRPDEAPSCSTEHTRFIYIPSGCNSAKMQHGMEDPYFCPSRYLPSTRPGS